MGPLIELLLGASGGHHLPLPPLAAQLSVKAGVPGWRRRGKAFASKWRPFESHLRPPLCRAQLWRALTLVESLWGGALRPELLQLHSKGERLTQGRPYCLIRSQLRASWRGPKTSDPWDFGLTPAVWPNVCRHRRHFQPLLITLQKLWISARY